MRDDLGTGEGGVHGEADAVLRFWFDETPPNKRFAKDEALDRLIATRFGALRDAVLATEAADWRATSRMVLAAIILLDQFSRNIHRNDAAAFAADPLARELASRAIDRGWDDELRVAERVFLYMPFMHAEDQMLQQRSVALFEALGEPENLKYARAHAAVIERFSRFPSRNAALGRPSTPQERAYLSQPGAGW